MQKTDLEKIYRSHHLRGGRYGYLYCHGKRGPFLKEWLGVGKKILDLGCRDGVLTKCFAEGNEVVGADIDRAALEMFQKSLGVKTQWLDLNSEWPFEREAFDAVVACEILEHLYCLETALQNIAKSLKPGGLFVGSVPNSFRLRNRLQFLFGQEFDKDPTHVRRFSYDKIGRILERDFTDVTIISIEGTILPFLTIPTGAPRIISKLFAKDFLWCCKRKKEITV